MNRFMGMMPRSEIKKEESFRVEGVSGRVTIQAGKNGWTILYPGGNSEFKDEVDSIENNFKNAKIVLQSKFKILGVNSQLEDELASCILPILMKRITTGYHKNGVGETLNCNLSFKFLHNKGGVFVNELSFTSNKEE